MTLLYTPPFLEVDYEVKGRRNERQAHGANVSTSDAPSKCDLWTFLDLDIKKKN